MIRLFLYIILFLGVCTPSFAQDKLNNEWTVQNLIDRLREYESRENRIPAEDVINEALDELNTESDIEPNDSVGELKDIQHYKCLENDSSLDTIADALNELNQEGSDGGNDTTKQK